MIQWLKRTQLLYPQYRWRGKQEKRLARQARNLLLCPVVPCSSLAIYKTQSTNKTVLEKGKEKAKGEKRKRKVVTRMKQRIDCSNTIVTNVVVLPLQQLLLHTGLHPPSPPVDSAQANHETQCQEFRIQLEKLALPCRALECATGWVVVLYWFGVPRFYIYDWQL